MPNLAGILKDEIRRLARKELRAELAATRKASTQYRKDIAAAKRQLREQARKIAALERGTKRSVNTVARGNDITARFSPKWLHAHREKLGLSAHEYATLIGVSAQTIYNWESGKTRPQPRQLEACSAVRKLGKREAWNQLDGME